MSSILNITLPAGWVFGAIGLVAFGSVLVGAYLIRSPRKAIEKQIELYRAIHWKTEPLSWDREIRNTTVMGWMALLSGIAAFVLIARQCAIFC